MNTPKNKGFLDTMFPTLFSHDATPQTSGAQPQLQIHTLAGREPFMLQSDVARIYGVETKMLNRARKRNPQKFRENVDYFQLDESEVPKCHLDYNGGHLPHGYTQRGAYMFATILQTPEATEQAFRIVEGFMAFERNQRNPAPQIPIAAPTIEIGAADYWQMKAEIAELKLEKSEAYKKRSSNIPYTLADEADIATYHRDGWSHAEIGAQLQPQRSRAAISRKVSRLKAQGKM
ncbi:MAG: ORF6N domain-containing protein [Desulfuromonadaceae bacterium]|nr:ORF6N domain-containing protein [Desulfuromonadaceae bacterium]